MKAVNAIRECSYASQDAQFSEKRHCDNHAAMSPYSPNASAIATARPTQCAIWDANAKRAFAMGFCAVGTHWGAVMYAHVFRYPARYHIATTNPADFQEVRAVFRCTAKCLSRRFVVVGSSLERRISGDTDSMSSTNTCPFQGGKQLHTSC